LAGQISGGELQTLISTLQNGNTQLGHIMRAIQGATPLPPTEPVLALTVSAAVAATAPTQFEGYVTVNIPGVGPRLIPYYSTE
jgi:hypothetical protein